MNADITIPRFPSYAKFLIAFFIILLFFSQLNFFYTIKYGQAAIISRFGKINRISSPGFHFKIPVIEAVDSYNTQKIVYETSEQKGVSKADYTDEPVDTSTSDGQQVSIRYSIRFRILPEKLEWIGNYLGDEAQIVERVIKTDSRSVVRNIAREYKAQELYTGDVFKFQKKVTESLAKSFAKNGIKLDGFLVRQVKFSPQYVTAVEQKQIEKEKVKAEENKAEQEKYKKEQKITRAEGEAKAQDILRQTIDPLVLQKMSIEKWDGKLPTYMGSDSVPFVNIP